MVGLGRGEAREGGCLLDALDLLTLHCFWKQEGCSCFRFVALYTTVGSSGIVSLFSTRNVWIWGVEIATAWCERSVFKLALRSDGFLAKPSHSGSKSKRSPDKPSVLGHRGHSGTSYGSRYVNDESVISHHAVWSVTVGETRWRGEKRVPFKSPIWAQPVESGPLAAHMARPPSLTRPHKWTLSSFDGRENRIVDVNSFSFFFFILPVTKAVRLS